MTWLYGPLHTAVEWTPPPKPKPDPTSVDDKDPASVHDRFDLNPGTRRHITKPILKHRTIGELLTSDLSNTSPLYTPSQEEDEWIRDSDISDVQEGEQRARPRLLHMKSESHVTRWPNRAFRKDSPPRIIAEDAETRVNTPSGGSTSQASGSDQDGAIACGPRKKHITFNTFVEQCIAIEKPKSQSDTSESGSATPRSNLQDAMYDDGSVLWTVFRKRERTLTLDLALDMTKIPRVELWKTTRMTSCSTTRSIRKWTIRPTRNASRQIQTQRRKI